MILEMYSGTLGITHRLNIALCAISILFRKAHAQTSKCFALSRKTPNWDCCKWSQECFGYQKGKINRHMKIFLREFE